jgi:hypothetical protein
MKRAAGVLVAAWIVAALSEPAAAQASASFVLSENAIHAGGNPRDGARPESASFRITPDAIGDAAGASSLASDSYRAEGGFVVRYRPPGDVHGVRFTSKVELTWDHEPSSVTYNLYRDTLASLPGGYGSCEGSAAGPPFVDSGAPAQGAGWYYLVTAENRLWQEGTKGRRSDGTERTNAAPCP